MKPTIIVCGHGTGISDAVARRFGKEGFAVAIVARNAERLSAAAKALEGAGVTAKAFPCDLSSPDAVRALVREVRGSLGPISVVHWNAYGGAAGDLTSSSSEELRSVLDISVHGMIAALQEALPDLKQSKGALLVTGGGLSTYDDKVDAMAVQWKAMGLAVGKAAQHKVVGLLRQRLASEGVYVGEVVVMGAVKGTAFDAGHATLEPGTIGDKFWSLYKDRTEGSVTIS
jgi:NAD(P)-dependent dehydrogenase (short-subunit alcohol dehydrogenase family)